MPSLKTLVYLAAWAFFGDRRSARRFVDGTFTQREYDLL